MVLLMKEIKMKRFEDKDFRRVIRNASRRTGRTVIREDYGAILKNWSEKNKPEITLHTHVWATKEPSPWIEIDVEGEIFSYVEGGTKPHEIWAGAYTGKSNKKALAFPSIFSPKTRPGVIGSTKGKRGGDTVFRIYVNHPGTKPRRFGVAIMKKRIPWFKRQIEDAMSEYIQTTGHAAK